MTLRKLAVALALLALPLVARAATVSENVAITITAPASSPSGTCIGAQPCTAEQIVDSAGIVWTVAAGLSYENGVADGGANITLLLYFNGTIYANTTSYGWWSHTAAGGWVSAAGDPRPAPLAISCVPPGYAAAPIAVSCSAAPNTVVSACSATGGDGNMISWNTTGTSLKMSMPTGVSSNLIVPPTGVAPSDCPLAPIPSKAGTANVQAVQP